MPEGRGRAPASLFPPCGRPLAIPSAPLSGAGRRLPLGSSPPAVGSERPATAAAAAHHGHIIAGAARPLSPAPSAPAQWRRCSPSPELSPPPGGPSRPPRWSGTASRRRPRPRPGKGAAGENVRGGRAWAAGELQPREAGGRETFLAGGGEARPARCHPRGSGRAPAFPAPRRSARASPRRVCVCAPVFTPVGYARMWHRESVKPFPG